MTVSHHSSCSRTLNDFVWS